MKKKLAYIGIKGLPGKAGVDYSVEAIVRGVDSVHYQSTVYCSRREVANGYNLPGVSIKRIPTLSGKHLNAASLFLLSAMHALCFGDYDLVHVHNVEACFVLPILKLRYKVMATSHGAAQARNKWGKIAKFLIRLTEFPFIYLSDRQTCVSQPLAAQYLLQYGKNVHHVPTGVYADGHIDRETTAAILEANGVEAGKYILFAAGRVIPTKGCHFLLEAFQDLEDEIKLLIVGDTSHVPDYARKLREIADDRVRFIPFISSKVTLYGLIRSSRLFVFPSTVEAMSVMLLEVAVQAVPIVCSDITENRCVLPEQTLFFESGNAGDLYTKLCWALEHPEEMTGLASITQQWVFQRYLWENIVPQYQAHYETILGDLATESPLVSTVTEQVEDD